MNPRKSDGPKGGTDCTSVEKLPSPCDCEHRNEWDGHCDLHDKMYYPHGAYELDCYQLVDCTNDCENCKPPKQCPLIQRFKSKN